MYGRPVFGSELPSQVGINMRALTVLAFLLIGAAAQAQTMTAAEQQQAVEADLKFRLGQALQNEAKLTMQVLTAQKHDAELATWFKNYFAPLR